MPPRESSAAEYHYHKILSNVIEEVLRRPSGRVKVPELASSAGFSRFHLARLFHHMAEETLEQFLRRIRLERAAYMLLNSEQRVFQISLDSGYRSPEAFSRAFRKAFGCLPTEAKTRLENWELEATSDLHWNAGWILDHNSAEDLDEQVVAMPSRYACLWRVSGDYSLLSESWERLAATFPSSIPVTGAFVTVYRDNLWTHPVSRTMSADIGWLCGVTDPVPAGMRKTLIPPGRYATTRFVEREERTAAWSHMWGRHACVGADRSESVCYDEYASWPLPFERVKTRLRVSLKR